MRNLSKVSLDSMFVFGAHPAFLSRNPKECCSNCHSSRQARDLRAGRLIVVLLYRGHGCSRFSLGALGRLGVGSGFSSGLLGLTGFRRALGAHPGL